MDAAPEREPIVLAVDDATDNVELVRRALLRRGGLQVLTALSGPEALSLLSARSIDVLVLDHRMPAMSGVELLQRAAIMGRTPPTIMLTAFPDDPEVVKARERGLVQCVISKPWRVDDLLLAVDLALKMKLVRKA